MLRWLLEEARMPSDNSALCSVVRSWLSVAPADSRQLLEAARLLAPREASSVDNSEELVHAAAAKGDLGLLRYLHEELGCGLGSGVLVSGAKGGSEAMLEWLVEWQCGEVGEAEQLDGCYLEAGKRGPLAMLKCLRRLGVPWSEGLLLKAIGSGLPLPVVQWLWGQGARISGQQLQSARRAAQVRPGQEGVEVVEWLEGHLV